MIVMKKKLKILVTVLLIFSMVIGLIPQSNGRFGEDTVQAATLSNPRRDADGVVTWDCVWFGSYPQSEVTNLTSDIVEAYYDSNGDAVVGGVRYRRISQSDATFNFGQNGYYDWSIGGDKNGYHYFKYEPIKWRVLSVEENDVFLLADMGIDCQKYDKNPGFITWENCALRNFLNNKFLNDTFTLLQQKEIYTYFVENKDNPLFGTDGGNDTTDKIFLLSSSDVLNKEYGFADNIEVYDKARISKISDYAYAMGANRNINENTGGSIGSSFWWLRTPGDTQADAMLVDGIGGVSSGGDWVDLAPSATRPALHINLLSSDLYSYAGTVSSDGTKNEQASGIEPVEPKEDTECQKAFIEEHLDFINSNEYQERMSTCWGKFISQGLDTTTGKIGENLYNILNTSSELLSGKCKSLSIFDNPYDAVITELILAQTDLKESSFELKYENEMLSAISQLESLCEKANSDWSLKESEYKTSLEKLIANPEDMKTKNPVFYNMCEEIFGQLKNSNNSDLNGILNGLGKASDLMDALNTYSNVVNWVADCIKYNSLVEAYLSTSNEFKQSLKDAVVYMSLNASDDNFISRSEYALMYENAYEKFEAFQTESRIAELLFKEYVSNGLDRVEDVFGDAILQNATIYVTTGLGIPLKSVSWFWACVEAYKTGWKISEAITDNGTNVDCRELARAYYYLEDAFMWKVDDDAYKLKKEQNYAKAAKFDASFTILKNLECAALDNYVKYLNAQQCSFVQGILNFGHDFNEWEISIAKIYKLDWQNIKCHDQDDSYSNYVTYSTMNVCCPTDVFIYNMSGEQVYSIENNKVTTRSLHIDGSIVGNMKLLMIPNIENYTVKIVANDNGTMNYQINTYDAQTSILKKTTNYLDVKLNKGDVFDGFFEEKIVLEKDGTEIEPSSMITDVNDKILISQITLNKESLKIKAGDSITLKANVNPSDVTFPLLSWTSSNEDVAMVDENGIIKAIDSGKCVVQCIAMDGSEVSATVEIEVISDKVSNDEKATNASVEKQTSKSKKVVKKPKATKITKIKKARKSLKVTWKKIKNVNGYQLQYSTSRKFKKPKKITVKQAKATSRTIKKLKSKKKYYIQIRTYRIIKGKKYYSAWSKPKSQKTK